MDLISPTVDQRAAVPGDTLARVVVSLLGGFHVTVDGREVPHAAWRRRKARSLVKLLALAPRQMLHREAVIEQLWPDLDGDAAGSNLRLHLHLARRALRSAGGDSVDLIHLHDDHLSLRGSPAGTFEIDVDQFRAAAATAQRSGDPTALQAAIDRYAGELLPEDRYEDWAAVPREVLRETYLSLLFELAQVRESRGEYDAAMTPLEQAVGVDAAHEDAHAALMRLHALLGRTGQALRQYARLCEALARELDAEPAAATRRLHADIAAGRFPGADDPSQPRTERQLSQPFPNHNLPAPLTTFVGRHDALVEIERLFATTRLMTLTGIGGSGKTRLALEFSRRLVDRCTDGVWLVPLAARADPALVADAVAAAAGVREQAGQSTIETLLAAFHRRSAVLVLDNCEHLIDACATLAETLLAGCPDLRILATSREALRVPGEIAWQVPPLALPSAVSGALAWSESDIAQLAQVEAVELFVNRVRWVRPDFVLTSDDAGAVVQICRRLDGLPLALELAAARASILTPTQLAGRLDDALGVLSSGSRTAPARHRTLQAMLDWSYALLDRQEQTLLRRLSVFVGGWTLEAAEAVCDGPNATEFVEYTESVKIEQAEVLPLLAQLIDKSLVQVVDRSSQPAGATEVRYCLLETVRQYAAAQLAASGEAELVGERHAAFFTALVESAPPMFNGPGQQAWLKRIECDNDNVRGAVQWFIAHGDLAGEARLCATLWRFWYFYSYLIEGNRRLGELVARMDDPAVPPLTRARILHGAGVLAWNGGDPARSTEMSQRALAIFTELGDLTGISATTQALGVVAELGGAYDEATRFYQAALAIREELGDHAGAAVTLMNLGNMAREQGEPNRASDLYERSLALQRATGDTRGIALALSSLAVVALDQGDYAASADLSTQSLELYQHVGAKSLRVTALNNLGLAQLFLGQAARSVTTQAACLRLAVEAGDRRGIAYGLEGIGAAIAMLDTSSRGAELAARTFGAADALREAVRVPMPPADRALIARQIASARDRLGDDAYQTGWYAGRSTPLDDAIADVLAVSDGLPADEPDLSDSAAVQQISPREREVAILVAGGKTNRQIAAELGMANRTVDTHVSNLLRKLRLASRSDVAAWATEHDLLPDSPS